MVTFVDWNTLSLQELFREAIEIAERYKWDTPIAIQQLRAGVVPEGFPREVGQTIALFLHRPIMGLGWLGWSRSRIEEYEQEMRAHARILARLRMLLAKIGMIHRQTAVTQGS